MVAFAIFLISGTAITATNYEYTSKILANMMRAPVNHVFARYERPILRGRCRDAAVETRT